MNSLDLNHGLHIGPKSTAHSATGQLAEFVIRIGRSNPSTSETVIELKFITMMIGKGPLSYHRRNLGTRHLEASIQQPKLVERPVKIVNQAYVSTMSMEITKTYSTGVRIAK